MAVKLDPKRWRVARKLCKSKAGGKCSKCGKGGKEAHHKVAKSVGGSKYSQSNLQFLCKKCHKKIHKTYRPWEKNSNKGKKYKGPKIRKSNKRTGPIRVKIKKQVKRSYSVKVKRPRRSSRKR